MEERRVEHHEHHVDEHHVDEHEVCEPKPAAPKRRTTNVNVGPTGATNVQESEVVEDTTVEPETVVDRRESTVERRTTR